MSGGDRSHDPFEWLWMTGLALGVGWVAWQFLGADLVALTLRLKLAELVVHGNAQRLEAAGGGMALAGLLPGQAAFDHGSELLQSIFQR